MIPKIHITIRKVGGNSWGVGLEVTAYKEGSLIGDERYYGYSKREAIAKFRREHGLKGRHTWISDYMAEREPDIVECISRLESLGVAVGSIL